MKTFLLVYSILVAAAFVIPFTILKDIRSLSGAFLFWTLIAAACIALLFSMMSRWNNEP